jgi:putative Ca2+/H+ antiporter (TMEM165/GDT1 family)
MAAAFRAMEHGSAPMLKLATIFAAVFIAELGDKTQLATLLFASDRQTHPVLVFLAAASALVFATGLAVLVGSQGARYLEAVPMRLIAGLGFIAIGAWSLVEHFRA